MRRVKKYTHNSQTAPGNVHHSFSIYSNIIFMLKFLHSSNTTQIRPSAYSEMPIPPTQNNTSFSTYRCTGTVPYHCCNFPVSLMTAQKIHIT